MKKKGKGGGGDEERKGKKGDGGRAYRHTAGDRPREGRKQYLEQEVWQRE